MDPKRKRIYIIIIVVCVIASIGLLFAGKFGGKGATPAVPVTQPNPAKTVQPTSSTVTGDSVKGYSTPAVFPANANFDFSVLDSSNFKQLRSYNAVTNQPSDLGRDDPFKNY